MRDHVHARVDVVLKHVRDVAIVCGSLLFVGMGCGA